MVRCHPPTACLPFFLCSGYVFWDQLLEIWAFVFFLTLLCMGSGVRWFMPISKRCGHLNSKIMRVIIILCLHESTSYLLPYLMVHYLTFSIGLNIALCRLLFKMLTLLEKVTSNPLSEISLLDTLITRYSTM